LLAELRRRGYATVEEPGRRIVQEELRGGSALPWMNETAFLHRVFELALTDRAQASGLAGWVFFDRGLIDAAAGLERAAGESALTLLEQSQRYHHRVFLAPPWPEIHVIDRERRHGLDIAVAEYRHLLEVYAALGYEVAILPKVSVDERADFILQALSIPAEPQHQSHRGSGPQP
jgi:predicted ATPase